MAGPPAITVYTSGSSYTWFKYTCCCSWVIIILSILTACFSIGALTSLSNCKSQICAQTELSSFVNNCSAAFQEVRPHP